MEKQRLSFATVLFWILAVGLGGFFILTGVLKLYSPSQESLRVAELIPPMYALAFAVLLGTAEVFAGVLLFVPRWRRAGAVLAGLMLAVFIGYMGVRYAELKGHDCGCMPGWHEALGPMFFVRDGLMLAAAVAIALFSRAPATRVFATRRRSILAPLIVLLVILGAGAASAALEGTLHPAGTLPLQIQAENGNVSVLTLSPRSTTLLYFYDPSCLDCLAASPRVGRLKLTAPLVVVPSARPEGAFDYMKKAGIKNAVVSLDYTKLFGQLGLRQVPALCIMRGSQPRALILDFQEADLEKTLRAYGLIG